MFLCYASSLKDRTIRQPTIKMSFEHFDPRMSLFSDSSEISGLARTLGSSQPWRSRRSRNVTTSMDKMNSHYRRAATSDSDRSAPKGATRRGFSEVGLGITTPLGRKLVDSTDRIMRDDGTPQPLSYHLFEDCRSGIGTPKSEIDVSLTAPDDSQTNLLRSSNTTPASCSWSLLQGSTQCTGMK